MLSLVKKGYTSSGEYYKALTPNMLTIHNLKQRTPGAYLE